MNNSMTSKIGLVPEKQLERAGLEAGEMVRGRKPQENREGKQSAMTSLEMSAVLRNPQGLKDSHDLNPDVVASLIADPLESL